MSSILDAVTLDLPPTATYGRRECTFYPGERGECLLVIRLWKGTRAGSKMERDAYSVMEGEPVGTMGRLFLVLNTTDPEQPDVYETVVGPVPHCTCQAGRCKAPSCKHVDSLTALVKEELL